MSSGFAALFTSDNRFFWFSLPVTGFRCCCIVAGAGARRRQVRRPAGRGQRVGVGQPGRHDHTATSAARRRCRHRDDGPRADPSRSRQPGATAQNQLQPRISVRLRRLPATLFESHLRTGPSLPPSNTKHRARRSSNHFRRRGRSPDEKKASRSKSYFDFAAVRRRRAVDVFKINVQHERPGYHNNGFGADSSG